jgi:carbon-monoxide dehydrogenase medium subunit
MIPAQFDLKRASSAAEAISLIGEYGDEAKLLAGGHSLIPLMKLRLAQPSMLIDIGRITDLSYIKDAGNHIAIGALTRHMDVEKSDIVIQHVPLLAHAASHVGDAQVRHRGTIGGSLAHADSASDFQQPRLLLVQLMLFKDQTVSAKLQRGISIKGFLKAHLRQMKCWLKFAFQKLRVAGVSRSSTVERRTGQLLVWLLGVTEKTLALLWSTWVQLQFLQPVLVRHLQTVLRLPKQQNLQQPRQNHRAT